MKPSKQLRVALILFGQPRFINLPYSFLLHKIQLRKYDVDVFGHCWLPGDLGATTASFWSGVNDLTLPTNAQEILRHWFPDGRFLFETQRAFTLNPETAQRLKVEIGDDELLQKRIANMGNVMSHFYSLSQALKLASENERQDGYDYYVVSRYDAVILRLPSLGRLMSQKMFLASKKWDFVDMTIVAPPEFAKAIDAYHLLLSGDFTSENLTPESLKKLAFTRKFSANVVQYIPIRTVLIRAATHSSFYFLLLRKGTHFLFSETYALYSKFAGRWKVNA